MSISKGEFKYKMEVMIDPALSPNAVTWIKLKLCFGQAISQHDEAMHFVFVFPECPNIFFHPFQHCELISQTKVKNSSFIGWFHFINRFNHNLIFAHLPLCVGTQGDNWRRDGNICEPHYARWWYLHCRVTQIPFQIHPHILRWTMNLLYVSENKQKHISRTKQAKKHC